MICRFNIYIGWRPSMLGRAHLPKFLLFKELSSEPSDPKEF